jgi:hypothetical protein
MKRARSEGDTGRGTQPPSRGASRNGARVAPQSPVSVAYTSCAQTRHTEFRDARKERGGRSSQISCCCEHSHIRTWRRRAWTWGLAASGAVAWAAAMRGEVMGVGGVGVCAA